MLQCLLEQIWEPDETLDHFVLLLLQAVDVGAPAVPTIVVDTAAVSCVSYLE